MSSATVAPLISWSRRRKLKRATGRELDRLGVELQVGDVAQELLDDVPLDREEDDFLLLARRVVAVDVLVVPDHLVDVEGDLALRLVLDDLGILDSSTGGSLISRLNVEWLGREKMTGSLEILKVCLIWVRAPLICSSRSPASPGPGRLVGEHPRVGEGPVLDADGLHRRLADVNTPNTFAHGARLSY
jgi:hypothetical protein